MLTVGFGGIWVEVLGDVVSRLLPVSHDDVLAMLRALRGRALLDGGRGRTPANLPRLAEVIAGVVAAAAGLGPRLRGLEINPLLVDGDQATVLDALLHVRDV